MKVYKKRRFVYKSLLIKHVLKDSKKTKIEPNLTMKLNKDLLRAYNDIKLSKEEFQTREGVFMRIKNTIEKEFNKMGRKTSVEKFGSFYTEMMVYESDIDLTVLSDEKVSENDLLKDIKKVLMKHDLCAGEIIHIKKAKTPILKLTDKQHNVKIDISVNKSDGIEAGKFIREKIEENEGIEHLVILLKYYLKRRNLSNNLFGGLNSFAQFLLVLNFIQLFPLADSAEISDNLFVYLMEFFIYYSKFPFERAKVDVINISYKVNKGVGIFVRDPTKDENSNVTQNCTLIRTIQDLFKYSSRLMEAVFKQEVDQRKSIIDLWFKSSKRKK